MPDPIIRTERLTKRYGRARGVDDLDLEVRPGEVFGFLGPNGAGKTTTIRLLLDFIRPTSGRALIFGLDSRRDSRAIRRRLGYLPGELTLYESLSGVELLTYFAHLRGLRSIETGRRVAERLDCDLTREIKALSHGNRQKVGLVQALMGDPELTIFDEPTLGLDPLVQAVFFELVDELRTAGRTLFVSSHNLPEIQRICDRVGIIREGRLLAVESVSDLKRRALRRLELRFAEPVTAERFARVPGVHDLVVDGPFLSCVVTGSVDPMLRAALELRVDDVISHEPSLEEIFLAFYGTGATGGPPPESAPTPSAPGGTPGTPSEEVPHAA
ncbi:MAG TPA: ABC transporter ATP-binding protein [Candidatus Limnocylindrales bacterium]|nr:ABC transporter ATP-binding protein [Candidatus Limnocylindrales bacterium]